MDRKMKKRTQLLAVAAISVLSMVLAGCSNSSSNETTAASTTSAAVAETAVQNQESEDDWKFEKDVTLIVPFDPGSAIDPFAQMFKQVAEKNTDVNFIIEYKPGGGTLVGMNYMFAKPHDGYTFVFGLQNSEALVATGQADYDEFAYTGIANTCGEQLVIVVRKDSPYESLDDIIEFAKENPGAYNWGGAGTLGFQQFFAQQVMNGAEVEFNYVPFGNAGETCLNVLNGVVDSGTVSVSKAIPYVESGDMRIIAQGLKERDPKLEERNPELFGGIPTVYETPGLDYDKFGMELWTSRDIACAADTPQGAIDSMIDIAKKVAEDPEWIEFVEGMGDSTSFCKFGEDWDNYKKDVTETYRELYEEFFADK